MQPVAAPSVGASSAQPAAAKPNRYAKCVEVSKRIRWDIERDVIRGRSFDFTKKFMPDGLSKLDQLSIVTPQEHRFLSQIQGRTYANMFAMFERFIGAKMLDVSRDHWLGDQSALEALVRFADEELKHQALFHRLEALAAAGMPEGYVFVPQPNEVASALLGKSTWAVLALTCHGELFTQAHYRQSIEPDDDLSELWKDVFLFHWTEESQHAILDELEWNREDAKLTSARRDRAVDELIELMLSIDGVLSAQSAADAVYFGSVVAVPMSDAHFACVQACLLRAYRWQYLVSGLQDTRFRQVLGSMVTPAQLERIDNALAPIIGATRHWSDA